MKKALLCLGAVLLAASVGAQDYAIKLNYPLKANQKYKYTAAGTQSTKNVMTSEGQPVNDEKSELKADLESTVTVLEVDAVGRPTKESHVVEKFSFTKDGKKKDLVTAGAKVVSFRKDDKMEFEVDGKPADSDVRDALDLVIDVTTGGPSDDEIYGSKERRKVGDSWNVNEEAAKKSLEKEMEEGKLKVQKISGKSTLEKVVKGDSDVVHVATTFTATVKPDLGIPVSNMSATVAGTVNNAYPTDQDKGVRSDTMSITFNMKGAMKPDPTAPEMKLDVMAKQTINTTRKLLK